MILSLNNIIKTGGVFAATNITVASASLSKNASVSVSKLTEGEPGTYSIRSATWIFDPDEGYSGDNPSNTAFISIGKAKSYTILETGLKKSTWDYIRVSFRGKGYYFENSVYCGTGGSSDGSAAVSCCAPITGKLVVRFDY